MHTEQNSQKGRKKKSAHLVSPFCAASIAWNVLEEGDSLQGRKRKYFVLPVH